MSITGESIHNFYYIDFCTDNPPSRIMDFLNKHIEDVESKHVAGYSNRTKVFFEYSEKVGYSNTILGAHRSATIENEYFRIQNMGKSKCNRAVRFVICKNGVIWSDNTHWTLAYLLQNGSNTSIYDIPSYIIDFREEFPIIYDKDGVVFDSISDIKSAIASAKRIQDRIDLGWRPKEKSYTIKQLYRDILFVIDKEDK
ncbi:hypothetical protein [Eisenbergiella sp.]